MKFGGVSLDGAERMYAVADIVTSFSEKSPVVVASAMKGVTDMLIASFDSLTASDIHEYQNKIRLIINIHKNVARNLKLSSGEQIKLTRSIDKLGRQLNNYKYDKSVSSNEARDFIISFGEQLCVLLLNQALRKKGLKSLAMNAGDILVTSDKFGNAKPDMQMTRVNVSKKLLPLIKNNYIPVITGFFGKTKNGKIATLGRGGSDYSASILANVCNARELIVWKEVNGVYTEDPKKNPAAVFLAELTYEKATELARAGAKVLHPESMEPVRIKKIPVRVKNVFNPVFAGSLIY